MWMGYSSYKTMRRKKGTERCRVGWRRGERDELSLPHVFDSHLRVVSDDSPQPFRSCMNNEGPIAAPMIYLMAMDRLRPGVSDVFQSEF